MREDQDVTNIGTCSRRRYPRTPHAANSFNPRHGVLYFYEYFLQYSTVHTPRFSFPLTHASCTVPRGPEAGALMRSRAQINPKRTPHTAQALAHTQPSDPGDVTTM